ncbi:hypothetical protein A3J17_02030 [Candidatus Curtissbacteria bacterium RIFCSPLOWO2_02_FULL_40_11]|uniref:GTPase Obg n=1 Tax=Candidatus Curtissbacteria bacterium RIFCSPHIGHO2_02_FULL_40_16b TaxID=1797714 RepID=A0A1F5G895_9BACT|nr:MAG: hypothetical protein A3D04_04990 [Candidatus Curtissbacteria bacterium RIFCSPHIGHO2_02_FULL_40_16b]OGE00397.1 MAG: hypothetical protein A3J17_02030 [Candidatus Curtissbacteria bacterium RIFCSPLOWO2_02_FULL_40_11]
MIDFARITVIGGKGGDGAGSFTHIKGKRRGKADGGDGGRGGNVFLISTRDLNTLEPFRYIKEYKAKDGSNGLSRRRKGAGGEDLLIKVPCGTLIKILNSKFEILNYDLVNEGDKIIVASGGEEGKGNSHLKDEYGRRLFTGEKGKKGEKVNLELELKLIADVGLIGLPNAGKSTLIGKLTAAKPKVADYPFTTLEPNLGVMEVKVISQSDKSKTGDRLYTSDFDSRLVIADIPGLIEGASKGRGLGDLFLRHIERTKILVHLIDVTESEDLWQTYQTVRTELREYSKVLVKKKEIIILNKSDLVDKNKREQAEQEFKMKRKKVVAISALTGEGLDKLIGEISKLFVGNLYSLAEHRGLSVHGSL